MREGAEKVVGNTPYRSRPAMRDGRTGAGTRESHMHHLGKPRPRRENESFPKKPNASLTTYGANESINAVC